MQDFRGYNKHIQRNERCVFMHIFQEAQALKETIIRIKQNSINYRSEHMNPTDLNAMMQILEDRKALQQLEKLHISIN